MRKAFDRLAQKFYKIRKQALLIAMVAVLLVVVNRKDTIDHLITPERPTLEDPSAPENNLPDEIKNIVDADELRKYYESIDLSNYKGNSLIEGLYQNGYEYSPEFLEGLADFYGIKGYTGTPEQDLELLNLIRGIDQDLETPSGIDYENDISGGKDTPTGDNRPSGQHNNKHNNKDSSNNPLNPVKQPGGNDDSNQIIEPTLPWDNNIPTLPSITNPNHKHIWGNWNYLNAVLEQRSCLKCGEKETQRHSFRFNGRKLTPKDGNTHIEELEYICSTCNYKKTDKKTNDCEFDNLYDYDDIYEYGYCECENDVKRLHDLDQGTPGTNGSTIYSCLNDGCNYTNEVKPNHQHKFIIIEFDENKEYKICICGERTEENHFFGKGKPGPNGSTSYECLNDGCSYIKIVKPDHNHKFIIIDYDENKEYKICICGETAEENHYFGKGIPGPNGSTTYECLHDGCSYVKIVTPDHNHKFIIVDFDENKEYKECSCGETEEGYHKLDNGTTATNGTTYYNCLNDGCSYVKEVKPDHNHKFIIINFDENKEYKECSCGETEEGIHRLDKGTTATDGTTTYSCLNDGCGYTKEVKPDHKHKFIIIKFDKDKEYKKCSCGETEEGTHRLDSGTTAADGTTYYNCLNEGCGYVKEEKPQHTHNHIHVDDDDLKEYYACSCGDKYTLDHDNTSSKNADCTTAYTCKNCGYTRSTTTPNHNKRDYIDYTQTDAICYSNVTECQDCHKELSRTPVDHPYELIDSSVLGDLYACGICGKTMTKPSSHVHDEEEYIDYTQTDTICYSNVTRCKDCQQELSRTPVDHPYELIDSSVLGDLYACGICGKTKTVPKTLSTGTTNSAIEAERPYMLIRNRY